MQDRSFDMEISPQHFQRQKLQANQHLRKPDFIQTHEKNDTKGQANNSSEQPLQYNQDQISYMN